MLLGAKEYPIGQSAGHGFLNELLSFDTAHLLPDDYLLKVNTQSMAQAVEARVPFLDPALVRFAATLPESFKASWRQTKIIQRKAMKKMGIPNAIVSRKKQGFNVPTAHWLKHGLSDVANQCFESLDRRKLFAPGAGHRVMKRFGKQPGYHSRQFWALLGLEVFLQTYMDADTPRKPKGFN